MDGVFSILNRVLKSKGLDTHASSALVVHRAQAWLQSALPPPLLSAVTCTQLQNGVLIIECSHSTALQECAGLKHSLYQYLRQECAFAHVSDILVRRT